MATNLEIAQAYQRAGFSIYPLAQGTRIPLKGSHGFKDGTTSLEQSEKWWTENVNYNVGLDLHQTNIVMLDIDVGHRSGTDGKSNLLKVARDEPLDTYIEQTPNGGLHIFYRYPKELNLTAQTNLFQKVLNTTNTGIDYNAQGVPIYPAVVRGKRYKPISNKTLKDIAEVPSWLLSELIRQQNKNFRADYSTMQKSWVGKLLDRAVDGVDNGSRNVWLTSIAGGLIRTGIEPKTLYNLMTVFNQNFLESPVEERELITITKSVINMEIKKRGGI